MSDEQDRDLGPKSTFSPMADPPSNDEEAETMLSYNQNEFPDWPLISLYQTYRSLGKTVDEAFVSALMVDAKISAEILEENEHEQAK